MPAPSPSAADQSATPPGLAATVIVPMYNARETMGDLLAALAVQDWQENWDLVIVDNGSTDESVRLVTAAIAGKAADQSAQNTDTVGMLKNRVPTRLTRERQQGAAAARNCGIAAARGELLVFIDSDCLPGPTWLREMVDGLRGSGCDAVGGLVRTRRPRSLLEEFAERQGIMDVEGFYADRPGKPPMVLTANFAMTRRALTLAHRFAEDLQVCEDADFCWRLQWSGGKLGLLRNVEVEHRHRQTVGRFARQMYSYGHASARIFARHRERLGRRTLVEPATMWRLAKAMIKVVVAPVRRISPYQRTEARLEVVRYGAFLAGRIAGSLKYRVVVI